MREAYQNDVCSSVEDRLNLKDAVTETIGVFNSRGILVKLEEFEDNANDIQKYILNYMKQFETILQFVRATRLRDLLLHLESTEALIKYFFAHDHQNYARLLPIYIATMQETQKKDPYIWEEFMQGNFCVTKGAVGFTSIAPDHGIEHENRKLKVTGGIVGITQNEKALDRYFLIASEVAKLVDEFEQQYGMNSDVCIKQHHEVTGGKLAWVTKNAAKLKQVIVDHGDPFLSDETDLYNILTKEVIDEKISKEILERDKIGQNMFKEFVKERVTDGKVSIWSPMKRRNIGTFKSANAVSDMKAGDKLIKIKEERGLLQRFIVVARSRPDLVLKECIGKYEFRGHCLHRMDLFC